MEQKTFRAKSNSTPCDRAAAGTETGRIEDLIRILVHQGCSGIPPHVRRSLHGLDGPRRIAAAMTIVLTDYGGTTPEETCEAIAEDLADLYAEFGEDRVLAICEEIQHSEIPEQSALYQEMFRAFNSQYFAGQLSEYTILVVYDVWFWETECLGVSPVHPPLAGASGFIDFEGRRILLRFLPHL
jgi:hypothetical protein